MSYRTVIRNNACRQASHAMDTIEPEHNIPPLDALIIPKAFPECKAIHNLFSRLLRCFLSVTLYHRGTRDTRRCQEFKVIGKSDQFMLQYTHGFKRYYKGHFGFA